MPPADMVSSMFHEDAKMWTRVGFGIAGAVALVWLWQGFASVAQGLRSGPVLAAVAFIGFSIAAWLAGKVFDLLHRRT